MVKIKSRKDINEISNDSDRWNIFIKNIDFSEDCWNWNGKLDKYGYGRFSVGVLNVSAHRASYVFHKGNIPKDLIIMHLCDNRKCVNPHHLLCGTPKQNSRDMVLKKRSARNKGEKNGFSKLTELQVIEIKKMFTQGISPWRIYKKYNVSPKCIYKIKNGQAWSHIGDN